MPGGAGGSERRLDEKIEKWQAGVFRPPVRELVGQYILAVPGLACQSASARGRVAAGAGIARRGTTNQCAGNGKCLSR